jgi:hypothetical protein
MAFRNLRSSGFLSSNFPQTHPPHFPQRSDPQELTSQVSVLATEAEY